MQLEIKLDGQIIVKLDVDMGALAPLLSVKRHTGPGPRSTDITPQQAEELLRRVDPKSVIFLKRIAQQGGSIKWPDMQSIFGIQEWLEYSSRFGRGITRAVRYITGNNTATLVWWDKEDWEGKDWSESEVFIDGPALKSLRVAAGFENM